MALFVWAWLVNQEVRARIDQGACLAMQDETQVAELSRRVRPMLIFDKSGSVVVDRGAGELLDGQIEVKIVEIDKVRQDLVIGGWVGDNDAS